MQGIKYPLSLFKWLHCNATCSSFRCIQYIVPSDTVRRDWQSNEMIFAELTLFQLNQTTDIWVSNKWIIRSFQTIKNITDSDSKGRRTSAIRHRTALRREAIALGPLRQVHFGSKHETCKTQIWGKVLRMFHQKWTEDEHEAQATGNRIIRRASDTLTLLQIHFYKLQGVKAADRILIPQFGSTNTI